MSNQLEETRLNKLEERVNLCLDYLRGEKETHEQWRILYNEYNRKLEDRLNELEKALRSA